MWTLYRVDCEDEVIYIGITQCVERRERDHWRGWGSKITRKHKPLAFTILGVYESKRVAMHKETGTVNVLRAAGHKAFGGGHV